MSELDFAKVWRKLVLKFHKRAHNVFHNRVQIELRKARRRLQTYREKGVMGAEARWPSYSPGNAKRKRSESESESKVISNSRGRTSSSSNSLRFLELLQNTIKPLNQGDRTSFRNLTRWLEREIIEGTFTDAIYGRVTDYAIEAQKNGRKPAAMFFATLRREIGYKKNL